MAEINPREAHAQAQTLEAVSRRDEAIASIHNSRGITSEFTEKAGGARADQEERDRLQTLAAAKDFEGTRTDGADAAGNVARNAQQATEGGIGVAASNSGPADQNKRVESPPVPPGGGTETEKSDEDDAARVAIPDNWESLSWPERQSLAKSLARGKRVSNGDDAEAVIRAELDRRKK